MIRRIDIFMPPPNRYGMLSHLTKDLFEAFQRLGVNCRLLVAERHNPEPFLDSLFSDAPDCTLSFNGLLPDLQGNYFCEMIKIPHVAYLLNSPYSFVSLAQTPWSIVVCSDVFSCHFFLGLNFDQVIFLPPGVAKSLAPDNRFKRKYEAVLLSTCIDYEGIRAEWKKKYSKKLCQVLDNTAEKSMSNLRMSLAEVLAAEFNEQLDQSDAIDPSQINLLELLEELDLYIKGKDRVELVRAVKECQVDVFGSPSITAGWEKYLKGSNVKIHGPIHFENALEVMKQSKIVLSGCPGIKNGGDERVFAVLACGALVIANDNVYLREHFREGTDMLFYTPGKWNTVNDQVQEFLSKPELLEKLAIKERTETLKEHTWDVRAKRLLQQLPPFLAKIKAQ